MEVVTHAGREVRWAPHKVEWLRAVDAVRRAGVCGWDSEFDGVDLRKKSPAGTARVHVWSLAIPNGRIHPRGHALADGLVLPEEALHYDPIRRLLSDPELPKVCHNARAEYHALGFTAGYHPAGVLDSLEYARVIYPERVSLPEAYGLKALAALIDRVPLGSFDDLFSEPNTVTLVRTKRERGCLCGIDGCRKRKLPEHQKWEEERRWAEVVVRGRRPVPIRNIVPGHRLWDTLRVYAAEDAVMALELMSHLRLVGTRRRVQLPWVRERGTWLRNAS